MFGVEVNLSNIRSDQYEHLNLELVILIQFVLSRINFVCNTTLRIFYIRFKLSFTRLNVMHVTHLTDITISSLKTVEKNNI